MQLMEPVPLTAAQPVLGLLAAQFYSSFFIQTTDLFHLHT